MEEVEKLVASLKDGAIYAMRSQALFCTERGQKGNADAWGRRADEVEQAAATLERLSKELAKAGQYTEAHERLDDLARERVAAAEAQVEAMRKALEGIVRACDDPNPDPNVSLALALVSVLPAARAALSAPAEERSSGASVDESAARRPSDVCDQTLRAALEEAERQIIYLHEKFRPTGSGEGVLAKIRTALASSTPESGDDPVVPALLEALKGMVDAYWRGSEDSDDEHAPAAVKAAIAAIARAEVNG